MTKNLHPSLLHTSATQWHSVDWRRLVPFDHVHGRHCGVCWTGEDGDSVLIGYAGQVSSASVIVLQPLFGQLWGEEVGERKGKGGGGMKGRREEVGGERREKGGRWGEKRERGGRWGEK